MSRIEENRKVVEEMIKRAAEKPTGTYEEMMTFQIGVIASMLSDISQSLAVIADGPESQIKSTEAYVNAMRIQEDKDRVLDKISEEIKQYRDSLPCDNTSIGKWYAINYILWQIIDKYRTESEEKDDKRRSCIYINKDDASSTEK